MGKHIEKGNTRARRQMHIKKQKENYEKIILHKH